MELQDPNGNTVEALQRGLGQYGLWFEAYSGAGSVEIPDSQSFRRLLLAITYLGGIPVAYAGDDPSMTYPPLLRFLAKPTGAPERRPLSELNPSPGPGRLAEDPNLPSLPNDNPEPRRRRQRLPAPQQPHREHGPQDYPPRTPQRDSPPQEAPNTVLPQLVVPLEEPEFEVRAEQEISEGLNRRRGGHDERFHNLYAQIAGISTNRRDIKEFLLPKAQNDTGLGNIFVVANTNCLTDTTRALWKGEVRQLYYQPSIIVWDEIHESKSLDVNAMEVIKGLMTLAQKPVHVVAMSGTPISDGPGDFKLAEDLALHGKMGTWYGEKTLAEYKENLELHKKGFIDLAMEVRNDENLNLAKDGHQLAENDKREAHNLLRRYDEACHRYTDALPLLQRGSESDYLGYPLPAYSTAYNRKPKIRRFNTPMGNVQMQVANNYKEYLRLRWQGITRSWRREPEDTRGPKPKFADHMFILDGSVGAAQNTFHIDTSLIGFAPGMATEVLKRRDSANTKKFRSDEVQEIFSSAVTPQRDAVRSSEYWDMVPDAFCQRPGSGELQPKIARICEIIDEMLRDKERHTSLPKNAEPLRKKAVICVPHAWQGFILITFLFKKYGRHNFTFVGAGMSAVLRSKLMAPFSRKTNKVCIEDSQEDDPIALISTVNFIGTGLNLIRCNYCIATSPLRSRAEESQLFARINRNGQTCSTHNYLLLDDGNPVDVVTFHRMQTRTALTVPLDDRKEGYNFILGANDDAEEQEASNLMEVDENEYIDNAEPDDDDSSQDPGYSDEEEAQDGAGFRAEDEIDRLRKRQRQQ
ncbi:hypothetical protein LA080_007560 [Diaporthe eres]|nr:hypothetical protein LA080_007560 [Diaporthe eres]